MHATPNREVLVACNTLKTEIEHLSRKHGIERRTVWVESKLHDTPTKLTAALQGAIDAVEDADRVLLGFANCGNAIPGVRSGNFDLIVPRVDDCISLVMGSQAVRSAYISKWRSLCYTDGWMNAGLNIVDEYYDILDRYGESDAKKIYGMMYGHYETLTFVDTGLYDPAVYLEKTRFIADLCELEQRVEPGTLAYIERLIVGPWDEDLFVTVGPHEEIPAKPFLKPGSIL